MKSIIAIAINRPESDIVFQFEKDDRMQFSHFNSLDEIPASQKESCQGLLVTLNQTFPADFFKSLPKLEYLGIYGSNTSNIDLDYCKEHNIQVTPVANYSDEETANFVVEQIGEHATKNCRVGIIGLGNIGFLMAQKLAAAGHPMAYFSPRKNLEREAQMAITFHPSVSDLLDSVEAACISVPPTVNAIWGKDLANIQDSKLIISTSMGPNFDQTEMALFLSRTNSKIVLDLIAQKVLDVEEMDDHWILADREAWKSVESQRLLDEKCMANLERFLG